MKIVYIIAMLAVLTAAVPQQQNLSFARQLLQDILYPTACDTNTAQ